MSQVVSQTPSIDYGETPAPVQAVLDIYKANMAHLPTDRDFRIRVAECLQNMRSYWTQPCAPGQTLYAHSKAKLGLGNVDINPKTFGLVADKRISELHEAVKLMRLLGHRRSNVDSSSDSSVSSAPRHLSPDEQKEHYRKQELKVSQVFTCCNHAITVVQCELTQHFIHNEAAYESTPESELPWGVIEQRNRYLFSHLFDDSKITDQQQMIMYVYGELMRRGYRKLGGDCYCEIMVKKSDANFKATETFVVQAMVLEHPGQIKAGYSPVCYVRTSHAACRLMKINFKAGKKSTGGQKVDEPEFIEKGDMCELVFKPTRPFVVDDFKSCEALSRVAMLEGSIVCMIGKVVKVNFVDDSKKK